MKRLLVLLLLVMVFMPLSTHAQVNPQQGHGAPTGVCLGPYVDMDTGNFYVCKVGQYALAGGSSSSTSSPSSAYTFSVAAGVVTATPNASGLSTFSGSDMAVVFNQVTAALGTTGGKLFLRNGVYNVNSMTLESATGCSSFEASGAALAYALAFPKNTPFSNSVQWIVEGESAPVWMGEAGQTSVNNAGVVINITSTAVSSVAAGSVLAGFWARPVTNCTLIPGNVSNDVHYKNLSVRFPTNQRGNEVQFASYFLDDVEYENVVADFNLAYNSIATGSAPVKGTWGSFGISTTVSSSGNWQLFKNVFSTGNDLGYDFQSEHVMGFTVTAIYNNFACEFGRSATAVFHPSEIHHFVDQENGAGCIFGPQIQAGTRFDLWYDFEFGGDANWYSTARAQRGMMTESTPGNSGGNLYYQAVVANSGIVTEVPAANLFSTGGQNFQVYEGSGQTNMTLLPGADTFTRPNNSTLGTGWVNCGSFGLGLRIASNAASSPSASAAFSCWFGPQVGADQFSQAQIQTIDANALLITVRSSTAAITYYDMLCVPSSAELIRKRVAGTFTTLFTGATCPAGVGDVMKLKVVGSTLWGYHTHLGVTTILGPVTDTSITTGLPGIISGATTDSFVNWIGGGLPIESSGNSVSSQPFAALSYNTLTNCNPGSSVSPAACGSAPNGTVVVPTTTATYTVNTTIVTTNSRITILPITDNTGLTGAPTCTAPPTPFTALQSGRVAGTSFTFTLPSTTGASCWTYNIVN